MYRIEDEQFKENWERLKGIAATVFHRMHVPVNDEDAWQVARIALWYAMQRHKPELGTLSTYYYRVLQSHLAEYFASCHPGIQYPVSLMRASRKDREKRLRKVECISLNSPVGADGTDEELADIVYHDESDSIEEVERRIAVEQMLVRLKRCLTTRQYRIISMLVGVTGQGPMSAVEVAEALGLSTHTVHVTYGKAVRAIRKLVNSDMRLAEELLQLVT